MIKPLDSIYRKWISTTTPLGLYTAISLLAKLGLYRLILPKEKLLTQEEITLLETHYKTSTHHRERERCKALLLSNEKNNIRTLAAYFSLDPDTIHNWIKRWEKPT